MLREPTPGWASPIHGNDALGDCHLSGPPVEGDQVIGHHAAVEMVRRVMAAPGEITLLALGRLTNIALALALEPRLASSVQEIIIMGGAISVPGNVSPVASANLYEDPEAAAVVYSSGAPLVQVGLDVCDRAEISRSQLDQVREAGTPAARLLTAATPCLQAYYRGQGLLADPDGVRYNDLPAVAYAVDPTLFQTQELYVSIETHSPLTRGQTVADRRDVGGRPANVKVCLEVDAPRLTALFIQRIAGQRPGN